MARTTSTMLALGTSAPPFDLPDFGGRRHALNDFAASQALLAKHAAHLTDEELNLFVHDNVAELYGLPARG